MKHLVAMFTTLLLASFSAQAQEETKEFVTKATVSNNFEIASSELALDRAESPAVRDFAQHMIKDHEKAAKDLKAAVKESRHSGETRKALDDKHAEMMKELGETSAAEFDRKYVEMQMAAHDEAVRLFEDYAQHTANEDASTPLRKFAQKTLPVLKEHDRQLEQLSQQVANL